MLTTIRQRLGAYFHKFVFLEGLPQPQVSPQSPDTPLTKTPQPLLNEAQGIPITTPTTPSQGATKDVQTTIPAPRKHPWNENTLTVLGTDVHTGEEVSITLEEQRLGQYTLGSAGTGKTTLLDGMFNSVVS